MAMLDKRLRRMEDRVIKVMPKDEQRNATAIGRSTVKPNNLNATATKKRQAEQAFADDLNSWTKPSESEDPPKIVRQSLHQDENSQPNIIVDGADHLPPYELQEHLTEVYFDYVYGQAYQLLHKPTYLKRLRAGQVPAVLNLSVCAVSARFSTHPHFGQTTAYLRGEEWAAPAREICMRRYDTPNLTIIMCYLILGLHEFGTCHGGRSWMLGGMSQRMACALQLHKNLDPEQYSLKGSEGRKLPQTDRETRLRTMWACFMMDRFNSSGSNRPPFVDRQCIEVRLPIKESLYILEVASPTEGLEPSKVPSPEVRANMGCSAYTIRIVSLWGDVVRYWNLGGRDREQCPIWSETSGYTTLSDQIHVFVSNLPVGLTWNKENLACHVTEGIANQFIFMHIVIRQVLLFLNRFALPLPGTVGSCPTDMPQDFIASCVQHALIAAHETSELLIDACDHRVVAPFAGYCAYFSGTVHIQGLASKSQQVVEHSKQDLATNIRFLLKIRQYWGMFHHVTEHLRDVFKRQTEAGTGQTKKAMVEPVALFQYGDWFEKYPNGIVEGGRASGNSHTAKGGSDPNINHSDSAASVTPATMAPRAPGAIVSPATPAGAMPVAATAAAANNKEPKRKRVKSVGALSGDTRDPSQVYAQVGRLESVQERTNFSTPVQPGQPMSIQQNTRPELNLRSYVSARPPADNLLRVDQRNGLQTFPASRMQYIPDMQHTVLDYMSNQSIQDQQPFLPLEGIARQDAHQHNLMSDLDRHMVMSSYAGIGNVCAPPGQSQSMPNNMEVPSLLTSPVDYPQGSNVGMASNMGRALGPDSQSSAWFLPFNYDLRNAMPSNGVASMSVGNTSGHMDAAFDIESLTPYSEFPNGNGMTMDTSSGLR